MNFDDTLEEAEFRSRARKWLDENVPSDWRGRTTTPADIVEFIREWQARKADGGWACIGWPKTYDGQGATPMEEAIWGQEEGELATVSSFPIMIGVGMAGPMLMVHGSDAQKKKYLPPMLRAEKIWCQLFSEPGCGSDLAAARTRAVRDGDGWIVTGQKVWTSFAHFADQAILLARTDPTVPKHKGLSFFIVDMKAPGVEVRPIRQMSGDAEFNEVYLTDVRIPDEDRVGDVGAGWRVAMTVLMHERSGVAGADPFGFDNLLEQMENLPMGATPAIENEAVRARLADFYVRISGLEKTNLRTLSALSRGEQPGSEASIGKLVLAEQLVEQTSLALDVQGMAGIMTDESLAPAGGVHQQGYLRDLCMRIAGGTDEILRNTIAERVLGLPPDLRIDKKVAFEELPVSGTVRD
jgi:alkylation response protein AidB-like acyl-CoA dehydrogenase